MSFRLGPLLVVCALALASLGAAPSARADDVEQARVTYERATEAFKRGSYAEAARDFARADELAPSPSRLTIALKTVTLTDDAVLGMTLVDRAAARAGDPELDAAAQKAREKFVSRASKLTVRCAEARPCTAAVDAQPVPAGVARWVTPGDHGIEITEGAGTAKFKVTVLAGAAVDWQVPYYDGVPWRGPEAPPAPPPPASMQPPPPVPMATQRRPTVIRYYTGPTSAWFWAGLGVTVVLGGVTTWSGVDTLSRHSAFLAGDDSALEPGKAAQVRTNVLLGMTGVAAVVTVVLGVVTLGSPPRGRSSAGAPVAAAGAPGTSQRSP